MWAALEYATVSKPQRLERVEVCIDLDLDLDRCIYIYVYIYIYIYVLCGPR